MLRQIVYRPISQRWHSWLMMLLRREEQQGGEKWQASLWLTTCALLRVYTCACVYIATAESQTYFCADVHFQKLALCLAAFATQTFYPYIRLVRSTSTAFRKGDLSLSHFNKTNIAAIIKGYILFGSWASCLSERQQQQRLPATPAADFMIYTLHT